MLNADRALIFRIVHRENLHWILENGLHCTNSGIRDPNYVNIGNADLIAARANRLVPIAPKGTLSDYVPFYFTPYSPMLLNIKTGHNGIRRRSNEEIVIIGTSLHKVRELGLPFVFTDRHAYLQTANFSSDMAELDRIDWSILQRRDFKRDPNDLEKIERYQAEALIHMTCPIDAIAGICCFNEAIRRDIAAEVTRRELTVSVFDRPGWYFQ